MTNVDFTIKVYESLCDNCGDCIDTCPEHCYSRKDDKIVWAKKDCTRCELCSDLCQAITTKFTVI